MVRAAVVFDDAPVGEGVLRLFPGANLTTGERHFSDFFGGPTSLEVDVLTVASAVFACDLAIKRGEREDFTRTIELTIPVVNRAVFEGVLEELQFALYRLSHDAWQIRFTQRLGTPESPRDWTSNAPGKVLLFSGGLDSLAAAVHYGSLGERIQLSSHITANQAISNAQEKLHDYLERRFPDRFSRMAIRVGGASKPRRGLPFPSDQEREETQRTRSFLFLALGALAARRRGFRDVVMIAENGQMAIHLPLTAGRISAFSTHTAHPEYVHSMGRVLSRLLDYPIRIENPFLYMTKAEVVRETVLEHPETLQHAVSCWKASRVAGEKNHCGFCVPCLVRRIAVEAHGVSLPEYKRDLLAEDVESAPPDDDGKRNLVELGEFVTLFEKAGSQAELEDLFPDLINPSIDPGVAAEMYRRFAAEARAVFDRYPAIRDFLR